MSAGNQARIISRRGFLSLAGKMTALVASGSLVAACGTAAAPGATPASEAKPTSAPTATKPTEVKLEPTTAPSQPTPAPAKEKVTLTFWQQETYPKEVDEIRALDADFEKETGVHIEMTVVDWAEAVAKYTSAYKAGTGPDIGLPCMQWEKTWWQAGWLIPVDDVIKKMSEKYTWVKSAVDSQWWDGHYIGVPWCSQVESMLWYRKDWFDKESIKVPQTSTEFVEALKHFTGGGRYGWAGTFNAQETTTDRAAWQCISMFGGDWFDKDNNVIIDAPEAVKGLQFYADIVLKLNAAPPGAANWGYAEETRAFATGKTAMGALNGWMIPPVFDLGKDIADCDHVMNALWPSDVQPPHWTNLTCPITLSRTCKHPDEAKNYAYWLQLPPQQLRWRKSTPGNTDMPVLEEVFKMDPMYEECWSMVHADGLRRGSPMGSRSGDWLGTGMVMAEHYLGNAVQAVLAGGDTAEELKKCRAKLQDARQKLGYVNNKPPSAGYRG